MRYLLLTLLLEGCSANARISDSRQQLDNDGGSGAFCGWPPRYDLSTGTCHATRASTVCLVSGTEHCRSLCAPSEYALSCHNTADASPVELPTGCHLPEDDVNFGDTQLNCCPCGG